MEKQTDLGRHVMSCAKLLGSVQLWEDFENFRVHGKFQNQNTEATYGIRYTQALAREIRENFEYSF